MPLTLEELTGGLEQRIFTSAAAGDLEITGNLEVGGTITCGKTSVGNLKLNGRTFTSSADPDNVAGGIVSFDTSNNVSIHGHSELRLHDDTLDKAYIGLRSHADTISHTVTFPSQTGSANQFLMTDNSGNLSWNSIASATSPKQSCIVATTGNITLSGTQTIDGISVTATKRVLVKDQTGDQVHYIGI